MDNEIGSIINKMAKVLKTAFDRQKEKGHVEISFEEAFGESESTYYLKKDEDFLKQLSVALRKYDILLGVETNGKYMMLMTIDWYMSMENKGVKMKEDTLNKMLKEKTFDQFMDYMSKNTKH